MQLLTVSVVKPKMVRHGLKRVRTGIFKQPATGRVRLGETNLDGDGQADLVAHGGAHKASYAYPVEHYEYWAGELNAGPWPHGQFGENFTVSGMLEDTVHIGDRFRIGNAVVEITQPRVPCFKLGIAFKSKGLEKKFLQSLRLGFYLRTVEAGEVGAGDKIERIHSDPQEMSVRDIAHLLYFDPKNIADTRRALNISALAPGWRESFTKRLFDKG